MLTLLHFRSYHSISLHAIPRHSTSLHVTLLLINWVYLTQVLGDILSVVQYRNSHFALSDTSGTRAMSINGTTASLFQAEWAGYTLGIMAACSLVFVALAWLFGQLVPDMPGSDGKSIENILLPPIVKSYFAGETRW